MIYAAVVLCCICPMLFFFFKWRRDKEAEMEGFSGPGKIPLLCIQRTTTSPIHGRIHIYQEKTIFTYAYTSKYIFFTHLYRKTACFFPAYAQGRQQ